MADNTLVSIIMPAYNAEKYIAESIDSVLSQTYTNWELLVIDDGSTDSTKNIVESYAKDDGRIFYYYQENGKQGKARNLGIEKSEGDLIAFLDSDDLWLPSKLEVSLNEFSSNDLDLLFTNAYYFQESFDWNELEILGRFAVQSQEYIGKEGLSFFLFENRIPMLTVLVKKKALEAVGGFRDRGRAEDYELWLNLLSKGFRLKSIDVFSGLYRLHDSSTSSTDKKMSNDVLWMLTDFFAEKKDLRKDYARQKIHWLITVIQQKENAYDILKVLSDLRLKNLDLNFNYSICVGLSKMVNLEVFKKIIYYILVLRNVYVKI